MQNWLPSKIRYQPTDILCDWLFTRDKLFTEPFFADTISACMGFEENSSPYKVVSDLSTMMKWADETDFIHPSFIIFHVSRCGSTLLTQLLCSDAGNIVLSEVPFFDNILRLPFKYPEVNTNEVNNYLQAAVKLYGQKRKEKQKNCL